MSENTPPFFAYFSQLRPRCARQLNLSEQATSSHSRGKRIKMGALQPLWRHLGHPWRPATRTSANERIQSGNFLKNKHTPEESRRQQSWCMCGSGGAREGDVSVDPLTTRPERTFHTTFTVCIVNIC